MKYCLDRGEYTCTLYDVFYDPTNETRLQFIWIVDRGENKWHKLFVHVDLESKRSEVKLSKIGRGINYDLNFKDISENRPDLSRIIGRRALLTVDYVFVEHRRAWVNVVGSYQVTTTKPEINALKPPSDKHFAKGNNKKRLPINKNE